MVGVAGERRRGLCESFVREMHQFTFKEVLSRSVASFAPRHRRSKACAQDVLERLRALRLPSRPILSKLESDVLDALAVAAERSEKAMRLACWLAKKQHSGLPVFVLNVDSIFDALARMERAEFAGALQRAVSEDRAPYILRRLRDSLHMVFASPAPAGSFF